MELSVKIFRQHLGTFLVYKLVYITILLWIQLLLMLRGRLQKLPRMLSTYSIITGLQY